MKKLFYLLPFIALSFFLFTAQSNDRKVSKNQGDERRLPVYIPGTPPGIMPVQHDVPINTVTRYILSPSGINAVSPSFRPYPNTATESEVEAYANPNVPGKLFVGWNSYYPSFYGTGWALTSNSGVSWTGSNTLNGPPINGGDPSVTINSSGNLFMNALNSAYSQVVTSKSLDNGVTWGAYTVNGSSGSEDKNHITIDDKSTSTYYNYLYCTWSDFSYANPPAAFCRSTDNGATWINPQNITVPLSGYYSQGVNLHTGPNGEVYFVCATVLAGSPYTEKYIGFAKSTNGGVNFVVNEQKIAINGIRGYLKSTSIRCNSFPWMAVDKTGGPFNGNIYVTWAQINLAPAGTDPDICFSKSTDGGTTFSAPIRVNNDPLNNGRDQWQSNLCVDSYGGINIVFNDSRNPSTNDSAETYVARSIDGGATFTNILVSDHRYAPKPIGGLAGGYQGDYNGIASTGNKVYPFWSDDYSGIYQVWTAPIDLGPAINHTPLGNTEQTTGTIAVNAVITPAGAPIVPALTKLFVAKGAGAFDSIPMTNPSGNNWTANITLTGSGTYKYYIRTVDNINRLAFAPSGAPASYYSFTAAVDLIPPVIVTTPLGNTAKGQWPATVTATVTDNIGVDSAWVRWYKNNPATGIKQFKLINTAGSNYSAAFNSLNSDVVLGDYIYYKIIAQDNSSNHNRDSSALFNFKIITLKLCEDFSGGVVPPAGWSVSGTYWTYNTVSGYQIGTGSAKFDFWTANVGLNEYLTTMTFDPSPAGDSIKFDLAHALYSNWIDSLIIESSTDGGATYSAIARMYAGADYTSTLCMSTTSSMSLYTPASASDWKSRAFALPTGTNKVHFFAKSAYGNNMYIDNICQNSKSTVPLPVSLKVYLEGFWNGATQVADTARVYLANQTTPYLFVDSAAVVLSTSGTASLTFTNYLGNYYIVVRHRNHLETWSNLPLTLTGVPLSYDFTTASSQAFGNNMNLVGSVWVLIAGDINRDGIIDALDRSLCWNDRNSIGYYSSDVNGDGTVDALDRSICWNNKNLSVQKPALIASPGIGINKESKSKSDLNLDDSKSKKVKTENGKKSKNEKSSKSNRNSRNNLNQN